MATKVKPGLREWTLGILIWIPLLLLGLGLLALIVVFLVPVAGWGVP